MTLNEEKILREKIKDIIRETIFDYFSNEVQKNDKSKKDDKEDSPNSTKKISKSRVINQLKSKGINKAQFAYKLWPEKDKDSARSYFYKCLNHETNDDGDVYSFDDKEATELRSMLNNQQI